MTDPKTIECDHCGVELSDDDSFGLEDETVCDECYDEGTFECCMCHQRWPDSDSGLVVMMTDHIDSTDLPTGVYLVKQWPFFSQPMIGMGHTYEGALQRVADLPPSIAKQEWWTPGQYLCIDCSAPYEKIRTEPIEPIYTCLIALRERALASLDQHCVQAAAILERLQASKIRSERDALLLMRSGHVALNHEIIRRKANRGRAWQAMYDRIHNLGATFGEPTYRECCRLLEAQGTQTGTP